MHLKNLSGIGKICVCCHSSGKNGPGRNCPESGKNDRLRGTITKPGEKKKNLKKCVRIERLNEDLKNRSLLT